MNHSKRVTEATMKRKIATLGFAVALTGPAPVQAQHVPQPKSAGDMPGTPPGTVKEYVEMGGRVAYVWVGVGR